MKIEQKQNNWQTKQNKKKINVDRDYINGKYKSDYHLFIIGCTEWQLSCPVQYGNFHKINPKNKANEMKLFIIFFVIHFIFDELRDNRKNDDDKKNENYHSFKW